MTHIKYDELFTTSNLRNELFINYDESFMKYEESFIEYDE